MKKIALFTFAFVAFGCAAAPRYTNTLTFGQPQKIDSKDAVVLMQEVRNGYPKDVDVYSYCSDILPKSTSADKAREEIESSANFQMVHTHVPKNGKVMITVVYPKNKFRMERIYCLHFRAVTE